MKEETPVAYRINIDLKLLEYLHPESGIKYSRMGAFRDLLELTVSDDKRRPSSLRGLSERELAVTVSGLAKRWNWHRATVRKFLSALAQSGAIRGRQQGGVLVLTVSGLVADGEGGKTSVLSEEEQRLNRWLCGYVSIEEWMDTVVHFIAGTDEVFTPEVDSPAADGVANTGERLHKLIAHLLLRHTGLFPSDGEVNEALQRVYVRECGKDLTAFLCRIAFAGLQVFGNRTMHDAALPCQSKGTTGGDMELILRHYLPYIGKGTPPCGNNPPGSIKPRPDG